MPCIDIFYCTIYFLSNITSHLQLLSVKVDYVVEVFRDVIVASPTDSPPQPTSESQYVAGYCVFKALKSCECSACIETFKACARTSSLFANAVDGPSPSLSTHTNEYFRAIDRGGLSLPSPAFAQAVARCHVAFDQLTDFENHGITSKAFLYSTRQGFTLHTILTELLQKPGAADSDLFATCSSCSTNRGEYMDAALWRLTNVFLSNYTKLINEEIQRNKHATDTNSGKTKSTSARKASTLAASTGTIVHK